MLYQIVYTSSATRPLSSDELAVILEEARARNEQLDVTGMLLYNDGNFLQVIEGQKATLFELYDMIRSDRRHTGVITLAEQSIEERSFEDWRMSFRRLDSLAPEDVPAGYTDFWGREAEEFDKAPGHIHAALRHFRDMDQ